MRSLVASTMSDAREHTVSVPVVDAVVFDVLGTMVDEPGGISRALREVLPTSGAVRDVEPLVRHWQHYVDGQQRRMRDGDRPYARTDVVDREAAVALALASGIEAADVDADALVRAAQRLDPWPDSVSALGRIASRFQVIALSNASRAALTRINAHAGLRWHQALSAQDAQAYKPAAAVYQLAVDAAGCPPERLLMVAAHAWDLRGAQAVGMRTAHVERPVGDPPAAGDVFDLEVTSLEELADRLGAD